MPSHDMVTPPAQRAAFPRRPGSRAAQAAGSGAHCRSAHLRFLPRVRRIDPKPGGYLHHLAAADLHQRPRGRNSRRGRQGDEQLGLTAPARRYTAITIRGIPDAGSCSDPLSANRSIQETHLSILQQESVCEGSRAMRELTAPGGVSEDAGRRTRRALVTTDQALQPLCRRCRVRESQHACSLSLT